MSGFFLATSSLASTEVTVYGGSSEDSERSQEHIYSDLLAAEEGANYSEDPEMHNGKLLGLRKYA